MKKFVTALAAFALLAALGGAAIPASSHQATPKLKLVASGNAEIGWAIGPDSPLDKGRSALNMAINGPTDGINYTNAYNNKWLTKDDGGLTKVPIGSIRNLSFDFLNTAGGGYVAGGAPRISIVFTNGPTAFLQAGDCDNVISGSGGTWSRADFTGQTAIGCRIYSAGQYYASDGTHSAWYTFVAAHPGLYADYGVVVQDESDSGPMRARIDRIAMRNYMQESATRVVKCPLESSC